MIIRRRIAPISMVEIKTKPTDASVDEFLAGIKNSVPEAAMPGIQGWTMGETQAVSSRCTGAARSGSLEWTINRRRTLIRDVVH